MHFASQTSRTSCVRQCSLRCRHLKFLEGLSLIFRRCRGEPMQSSEWPPRTPAVPAPAVPAPADPAPACTSAERLDPLFKMSLLLHWIASRGHPKRDNAVSVMASTPSQAVAQGLPQQSQLQCGSGFPEPFHPDECPLPQARCLAESFLRQELLRSFLMNSVEYTR